MEEIRISDLRPKGVAPPLQVHIMRKWIPAFRENETHYVLVDKEGFGIQAVVKGDQRKHVEPKLNIQSCYRIEGYACIDPDDYTNTLSHPATMCIGSASTFTPISETTDLPDLYFEFATRRKLEVEAKKDRAATIDYIGVLQEIEDKTTKEGRPYVVLLLRDSSNQDITVKLWEEIATTPSRFDRAQIDAATTPAVIAITALKPKIFTRWAQLQSTNATYVYLNPNTVETGILKDMYNNPETQNSAMAIASENCVTISSLQEMENKDLMDRNFIIDGTISHLITDKHWHYTACPKCGQTSFQTGEQWFCTRDGNHNTAKHL
ncbi:putative nucleic acid-binding protein [Helianthus annuus]|uniref:Nucleic acid-binding protein n=2 Tax=Helianthus annuus TaxID=4232 RepID=A0A9K3JP18_HELAN|nr:putative nucleic acid-binding protein [Helianthus annuus]KAJ0951925.1 putative nucleic acid-binding protein [Helianthus annuus]